MALGTTPTTGDPALTVDNYMDATLPDLEEFFSVGGTVELVITTADAETGDSPNRLQLDKAIGTVAEGPRVPVWRDLVISEIMWGLDVDPTASVALAFANAPRKQWIEIYNTTDRHYCNCRWYDFCHESRW